MAERHVDSIADQIEDQIFQGDYENGDRLDEVKLAAHFGVSRTPVREALNRLNQSGLVDQIPRRGAFVRQPGPIELLQMFEAMAEIEAGCARLAALRVSDEALDEMDVANDRCEEAANDGDADRYYFENEIFHNLIYRETGNQFLEQQARTLHRRLRPFRRTQLQLRGRMNSSLEEHKRVVEALRKGDANKAASSIRDHVAIQGEKFHHLMAFLKSASKQ